MSAEKIGIASRSGKRFDLQNHLIMKTSIAIWLGYVIAVSAQTNIVSTNSPTTNAPPRPYVKQVVVTKEMVLAGLMTISNQILQCHSRLATIAANLKTAEAGYYLQRNAHKITAAQVNEFLLEDQRACKQTRAELVQSLADLKLQDFNIRQRYAVLLRN